MSSKKDTRTEILEATRKLMVEKRGTGVRMSDIAEATGISRQAVYLHFANRTDLIVETVLYADKKLGAGERAREFRSAESGVEMLEGFIEFWGNYIGGIHGIATALRISKDTDEAAAAAWEDRMKAVRGLCRDAMKKLKSEGKLAEGWTVERATDMLWSVVSIDGWEQLVIERRWAIRTYVDRMKLLSRRTFVVE